MSSQVGEVHRVRGAGRGVGLPHQLCSGHATLQEPRDTLTQSYPWLFGRGAKAAQCRGEPSQGGTRSQCFLGKGKGCLGHGIR